MDCHLFHKKRALKILIEVEQLWHLRQSKVRVDLKKILEISLVFNVSDEIRDLITNDFGQILTIDVDIQRSQILIVMALGDGVTLFPDSSGVGSKEIQTEIVVVNLLVLLVVILWNISLLVLIKIPAN